MNQDQLDALLNILDQLRVVNENLLNLQTGDNSFLIQQIGVIQMLFCFFLGIFIYKFFVEQCK
ncbi:MAG TPA: hypothetical protein DCZ94_04465 [Lentisphaeria bacterium]|nr:MAG: hypothetical protein A2X48_20305 [Lentisphaerae bacterium GWF2_49_21]HBC86190.1 hypothetical protein [Lentisphaeria bacterium]